VLQRIDTETETPQPADKSVPRQTDQGAATLIPQPRSIRIESIDGFFAIEKDGIQLMEVRNRNSSGVEEYRGYLWLSLPYIRFW